MANLGQFAPFCAILGHFVTFWAFWGISSHFGQFGPFGAIWATFLKAQAYFFIGNKPPKRNIWATFLFSKFFLIFYEVSKFLSFKTLLVLRFSKVVWYGHVGNSNWAFLKIFLPFWLLFSQTWGIFVQFSGHTVCILFSHKSSIKGKVAPFGATDIFKLEQKI